MKAKRTAQEALIAAIAQNQELLARIKAAMDDHLGADPDNKNWAIVGDANYVRSQLEQIIEFLRC